MTSVNAWIVLLVVLFVIDLVAVVRPRIAVGWLRQWLAWSNRISRCWGVERQIVDERRCVLAVFVVAVAYFGLLVAIAVLLLRGRL
jgi:hypothetical protein